jgi:hypothetical protein
MKLADQKTGCACCGINRRQFLAAGCAACAGAAGLLTLPGTARAAQDSAKMKIKIIYSLHAEKQPAPDWPNVGFDFRPVMDRINATLASACPDFEFIPLLATGEDEAKKIVKADDAKKVDGYIVYQMNCWNQVIQTIAKTGKPVLYADFQYGGSGGFLVYMAKFLRDKSPNVGFVASSNPDDLVAAVKCFEIIKKGGSAAEFAMATAKARIGTTPKPGDSACTPDSTLKVNSTEETMRLMKASKILAVRDQTSGDDEPYNGIPVVKVAFAELNDAWKNADKEAAQAVADRWKKAAAVVDGVSDETLLTSAAMYLGMKDVLQKHGANAITVNCLGGFYGGHIHAYPCLGFHELCNEGLVGACECDVRATASMLLYSAMTGGRTGFISDPIIDTSKRQIVYAHCVAPNRAFGPQGEANPFEILTHSEDRQGASVRSILPLGYMTTTISADSGRKEILFHQGKAVANDPDDRACRTKLGTEPMGDIEKLFTQWDLFSWHRVTAYGDLKEPVVALADAMGYKMVYEA